MGDGSSHHGDSVLPHISHRCSKVSVGSVCRSISSFKSGIIVERRQQRDEYGLEFTNRLSTVAIGQVEDALMVATLQREAPRARSTASPGPPTQARTTSVVGLSPITSLAA